MSPRERKPFFSKDRLKEYGVKTTALVALGAAGLGLTACGPSNAGAEKSPTVATATATPGASETSTPTPSTTETTSQSPSSIEVTKDPEAVLAPLKEKPYSQAARDYGVAETAELNTVITNLINIPTEEWSKLPKGEQAYRAALYVEMKAAWRNHVIGDTQGDTTLDNDLTYPGVTPFMSEADYSKLSCMTKEGLAQVKELELKRRAWIMAIGSSKDMNNNFAMQIRDNILSSGLYWTGEGNPEVSTATFNEDDISKFDTQSLFGKQNACNFGLTDRQFLYNLRTDGAWINPPVNKPVAGFSTELIATGHEGRMANVVITRDNG